MRILKLIIAAATLTLVAACDNTPSELQAQGFKQDPVTKNWYREEQVLVLNGCSISSVRVKGSTFGYTTVYVSSCAANVAWSCGKSTCSNVTTKPTSEELKQQTINAALAKLTPEEMAVLGVKR